jgi:hypothetical protein
MHDLLNLIANIVVFGLGVGLINRLIPMPGSIKQLLNLLVLIVLLIYVLQFFGLIQPILPMYRVIRFI